MPDSRNKLERLGEAVTAYLEFQASGRTDRDTFLADNEELRELLLPMFDEDAAAEREAEKEADAARTAPADQLERGATLADFRIVREIGRGGMGVVYEAEQLSLHRRVALKVLPPLAELSAVRIERFRREAAATARLNHPGILPIYSVGETNGIHYFAMELVDGESLQHALQARRDADASSDTGFGIVSDTGRVTEVIHLVAQIAEGLAEAHANGVIHRDIKPHNILLDRHADPRRCVRIVDFGLAKDLDRATVSRTDDIAGTPQYMSPEQIAGLREVDVRTDIFSLGVLMYECLTLSCPFQGNTTHGVMFEVVHTDPRSLRTWDLGIPTDVDVVCTKALEKDPRDRYQSVAEFAADLRRLLDHRPIVAQPPGLWRRSTKFARRHPYRVSTVVMAIVLVLGGLSAWFVHLNITNRVLTTEKAHTQRQRDRAVSHLKQALSMLDEVLDHLEDLAVLPGFEASHREMSTKIVRHLDALLADEDTHDVDAKEVRLQLCHLAARARARLAKACLWVGDRKAALAHLDTADAAVREMFALAPDDRRAQIRAATQHIARGTILSVVDPKTAAAEFEHAAPAFRALAETEPDAAQREDFLSGQVEALVYHGRMLSRNGGLEALRRAKTLFTKAEPFLGELGPDNDRLRQLLHDGMANTLVRLSEPGPALAAATRAIEIGRNRVQKLAGHPRPARDLAAALRTRANLYSKQTDRARSVADLEESLEILTKLVAGFSVTRSFRIDHATTALHLATRRAEAQRFDAARKLLDAARKSLAPLDKDREVIAIDALAERIDGMLDLSQGHSRAAITKLEVAAKEFGSLLATKDDDATTRFDLAYTLHYLAMCHLRLRQDDAATTAIQRAIELQRAARRLNPTNAQYRHWLRQHLGILTDAYTRAADHAGIRTAVREALELAGNDGRAILDAGSALANCMYAIQEDAALTPAEREAQLDACAAECMAALSHAVDLGYRGAKNLSQASVFGMMRERPEFQKLVRRVVTLRKK